MTLNQKLRMLKEEEKQNKTHKKKTWYVWTRSKVTAVLGGTWP